MSFPENLIQIEAIIPIAVVTMLGLLALTGIKELFKEAVTAFNQ